MNKLCYRIVFNRSLGLLQVVPEIARRRAGSAGRVGLATGARLIASMRPIAFSCYLALGLVAIVSPPAYADIVADPSAPGYQQPTVLETANGVPQVNIQTPSAAGVSRNTYQQFDVEQQGAILNNARTHAQTQLGGWVQGNPWLARGTARIILNEVNASAPSRLQGYLEVAGDRAQVVIANPAGITCDGCGFINTQRATLTTGTPVMREGALDSYLVRGGTIDVQGQGLDASSTDYTDVIARSVKVNAGLWAKQLHVTTGVNEVSADQTTVNKQDVQGGHPAFALDVGSLGGMYAQKIVMVGTEHGVGVRNAGTLGAQAGELIVTADGRLENSGTLQAMTDVRLDAQGEITNRGALSAQRELVITTPQAVDNSKGTMNARRVAVKAQSLTNREGVIEQTGGQGLMLHATNVSNRAGKLGSTIASPVAQPEQGGPSGQGSAGSSTVPTQPSPGGSNNAPSGTPDLQPPPAALAAGELHITETLNNEEGRLLAGGEIALDTTSLDNREGVLEVAQLTVTGGDVDNRRGELRVNDATHLTLDQLNNEGGKLHAAGDLTLSADMLNNRAGLLQHAGHQATRIAVTRELDNSQGTLQSNAGALTLDAGLALRTAAFNGAGGHITTPGAATLHLGKADHHNASLEASSIALQAESLDNRGGTVHASGNTLSTLVVSNGLDNSDAGQIASQGDLAIEASKLDNRHGVIEHAGGGALTLETTLLQGSGGKIASNGALSIRGDALTLAQGTTTATQITMDTGTLDNNGGALIADTGPLDLIARGAVTNQDGKLLASGPVNITAGTLDNQGGQMASTEQAMTLATTTLDNSDNGLLAAKGDLHITAVTLDNREGRIEHAGDGALTLDTLTLQGSQGSVTSDGALSIHGEQTLLQGALTQARQITVDTHTLTTADGKLIATDSGPLRIVVQDKHDNSRGYVASNGALQLRAGALLNGLGTLLAAGGDGNRIDITAQLDNTEGAMVLAGQTTLSSAALNNQRGKIVMAGDGGLTLATRGLVDNSQQGRITSAGDIELAGETLDNRQGIIESAQNMAFRVGAALDNREGRLVSAGALHLDTTGSSNNAGGVLQAQTMLQFSGAALNNTSGTLVGGEVRIDTHQGALTNSGGTLASTLGGLDIASGTLDNSGGLLQSTDTLAVDTHDQALNNSHAGSAGGIISGGALTLHSGDLLNLAGVIHSNGALIARTGALDNQHGKLTGQDHVDVAGTTLDNRDGLVQAEQDLTLTLFGAANNQRGLLAAGQALQLHADSLINQDTWGATAPPLGVQGTHVTLSARHIDNRNGEVVADRQLTLSGADTLDNSQGDIASAGSLVATLGEVTNREGTVRAGDSLRLAADSLSGDGRVLAKGDASLTLLQDFTNEQDVAANGKVDIVTAGSLTNRGTLQAGELAVQAANIDNQASGQFRGNATRISASNTLTNRGLIDGLQTRIQAGTLDNVGSGRLYGNLLAISAHTLQNREEGGLAATIAARERLDIGTTTLTNRGRGLIFSAGDMAIGGALDANDQTTGRASLLQNDSATLESLGDMSLFSAQLLNRNLHFDTEQVQVVGPVSKRYIQPDGAPDKLDESEFLWEDWSRAGQYRNIASGDEVRAWTQFEVTHTEFETRVKESDPALIRAGGNITLGGDNLTNDKSQIVAGGALLGDAHNLHNEQASGWYIIRETGTSQHTEANWHGGFKRYFTRDWGDNIAYQPGDITQQISLDVARTTDHSSGGSGYQVAGYHAGGMEDGVDERARPTPTTNNGPRIVEVVAQPGASDGPAPISAPATSDSELAIATARAADVEATTPAVIRTLMADMTVPNSSLFQPGPANGHYLVESDPNFTDYRAWLGSDYMLTQLAIDPALTQKRLGDGFYEQMLVRDQIAQLTGRRFLDGYSSDEAQYRALLDAGATVARNWQLRPGVALSPEQMAQLTSDIVWLVERDVRLADGSVTRALVPQVYVRVKPGDLDGSGTLLSANRIDLKLDGDVVNTGTIAGRQMVQLTSDNVRNLGRIRGDKVALDARYDIDNIGGTIAADTTLALSAGRDLNVTSTTQSDAHRAGRSDFSRTNMDRVAGLYVTGDNGTLLASAGRDLTLLAAEVSNSGKGQTSLVAGRDLILGTVTLAEQENNIRDSENYLRSGYRTEVGSKVSGAGDVQLQAGRNLTARAAGVSSEQGALTALAGGDLVLQAGESSHNVSEAHKSTSRGLFSSSTTITRHDLAEQQAVATTIEGKQVTLQGNNVTIAGSNVVSDLQTDVQASHDLTIAATDEVRRESHFNQTSKSGLLGSGGLGFTIGKQSQSTDQQDVTRSKAGSTVGSTWGNVNLSAGNQLNVAGSDLIAGKDMTLSGKDVTIRAEEQQATRNQETRSQSGGLTIALTGGAVTAAQSAYDAAKSAVDTDNGRLKALQGTKAAMSGYQAYQESEGMGSANTPDPKFVGIAISAGNSRSQSNSQSRETNALSSELSAGGDVTVQARGDGSHTSGDLVMTGSGIKGKNVTLAAARDLVLQSAVNDSQQTGSNSSSGWNVGLSFGFSDGGAGLSVFANMNAAKGKELGNTGRYTETNITAGDTLTLTSGRDATLLGAQVSGDKVNADIGRHLTLTSQQDSDHYQSKQDSVSAGGSFTFGTMTGSGYINASRQKVNSDYQSVEEQTGVFAGKQGFDIRVGEHTQLDGAVLAGSDNASNNRLSTGTLGWSDIHNKADYKVESQSIGISSNGGVKEGLAGIAAQTLLNGGSGSGSASSTTHAAISQGDIELRSPDQQQQDVTTLLRDPSKAANGLSPIFDKKRELEKLQEVQLIGELGQQATQLVVNEKMADAEKKVRDNPEYANTKVYKDLQEKWGVGSDFQRGMQAATAALQGLAGGDITQAAAGAASPYLAKLVKQQTTDGPSRILAHALTQGALAAAQNKNAMVGATGAATGELVGMMAVNLYNKDVSELTEGEKDTVSTLATLAAGLAGGLTGDNTASALAGAQTGKTVVENNYLSSSEKSRQTELNHKKDLTPQEQQEREALNRKDLDSDLAVIQACNGQGDSCQAQRDKAKSSLETYINLTYQNPKESQAGYQQIQNLLNSTDPNAKEVFNIVEGYTKSFMSFGYTEEEARTRAGVYVGTMYVAGGVSSVLASGALVKQFGKDVAPGIRVGSAKPSLKPDQGTPVAKIITISKNRHPESAQHIEDAVAAGKPDILTIDRPNTQSRRRDSLRNTEIKPGLDRDEYPPALFQEGGDGASVRHINPSDNRGSGACIGAQCRGLPDGTKIKIEVGD